MLLGNGFGRSPARAPSKETATLDLNWKRPNEFEIFLIFWKGHPLMLPLEGDA